MTAERQQAAPEQIDRARQIHGDDDVQIDDNALVSEADEGYWVQAWVWVPRIEELT